MRVVVRGELVTEALSRTIPKQLREWQVETHVYNAPPGCT